jgi:hypothetical protein
MEWGSTFDDTDIVSSWRKISGENEVLGWKCDIDDVVDLGFGRKI